MHEKLKRKIDIQNFANVVLLLSELGVWHSSSPQQVAAGSLHALVKISLVLYVRDPGAILDCGLTFKHQVSTVLFTSYSFTRDLPPLMTV